MILMKGTKLAYQLVPLAPITVIGLQVSPMGTFAPTTTPRRPLRTPARPPAFWTLWQHCTGPVLHWLGGGAVPPPVGVATARVATARATKAENLNCILEMFREY